MDISKDRVVFDDALESENSSPTAGLTANANRLTRINRGGPKVLAPVNRGRHDGLEIRVSPGSQLRNRVAANVRHPDVGAVKGHANGSHSHSEDPERGAVANAQL